MQIPKVVLENLSKRKSTLYSLPNCPNCGKNSSVIMTKDDKTHCLKCCRHFFSFKESPNNVCLNRIGSHILVGGNKLLSLIDLKNGKSTSLTSLNSIDTCINSTAFNDVGNRILIGCSDGTARILHKNGIEITSFKAHKASLTKVAYNHLGSKFATASVDGSFKIWDSRKLNVLLTIKPFSYTPFWDFAFSPDGSKIVTNNINNATLWDTETGKEILSFAHNGGVYCVAFSADGNYVATGGYDCSARIWNAETGKEIIKLPDHESVVTKVAFSPGGSYLLTGSNDNTIKIWNFQTGEKLTTLIGHERCISSVCFSPEGNVVSSSDDGTVRYWNTSDLLKNKPQRIEETNEMGEDIYKLLPKVEYTDPLSISGSGKVYSVAFSPDGSLLVSGSSVWEVETGKQMIVLYGHNKSTIRDACFSPDGTLISTAGIDNTAKVWNSQTGAEIFTLKEHSDWVISVCFSPDGENIATSSCDNTIKIWCAQTGKLINTINTDYWPESVRFSADKKTIISTNNKNGEIILYDILGNIKLKIKDQSFSTINVCISPNGKKLASINYQGIVNILDAQTGEKILTINAHDRMGCSIAFSPDGKLLATGSVDNKVKIWDVESGKELISYNDHSERVSCLAFSPDGKTLATGSWDKSIKIRKIAELNDTAMTPNSVVCPTCKKLQEITPESSTKTHFTCKNCLYPFCYAKINCELCNKTLKNKERKSCANCKEKLKRFAEEISKSIEKTEDKKEDLKMGSNYEISQVCPNCDNIYYASEGCLTCSPNFQKNDDTYFSWANCPICNQKQKYQYNKLEESTKLTCVKCWSAFEEKNPSVEVKPTIESILEKVAACEEKLSKMDKLEESYEKAYQTIKEIHKKLKLMEVKEEKPEVENYWKKLAFPSMEVKEEKPEVENYWKKLACPSMTLLGHKAPIYKVAYSKDGKNIVTCSGDKTAKVWDLESRKEALTLKGHTNWLSDVAYSPNGNHIATTSRDGTVRIWNAKTGTQVVTAAKNLDNHTYFTSVCFYPGRSQIDNRIIVGTSNNQIKNIDWWMSKKEEYVNDAVKRYCPISSLDFNSDRSRVVSGSHDGTAKISDPNSGETIHTFKRLGGAIYSVAYSPDDSQVAIGGSNNTFQVWDVTKEIKLKKLEVNTSGASGIYSVAFSPDGKYIVTGSYDGTAKVWDIHHGKGLFILQNSSPVYSVTFSPDGKQVATAGEDCTVKIWDIFNNVEDEEEILDAIPVEEDVPLIGDEIIGAKEEILDAIPVEEDVPLIGDEIIGAKEEDVPIFQVSISPEIECSDLPWLSTDDLGLENSTPDELELVDSPEEVPVEVVEGEGEMTELARVTCGQWSQEVHAVGKKVSSVRKDLREVFNIHEGAIAQVNGVTINDPDYTIKGGDHVEFIRPVGQKG